MIVYNLNLRLRGYFKRRYIFVILHLFSKYGQLVIPHDRSAQGEPLFSIPLLLEKPLK